MDYSAQVKQMLNKLGYDKPVCGQNKRINEYYNIWRGRPSWLDYNYRLANGKTVAAKLKTLNQPRYICRSWANNYANEDTSITIPDEKSNDRLAEIFTDANFFGRFNNFVEMFMGLGIAATVVETDALVDEETKEVSQIQDAPIKIKMIPGRRVIPVTIDDGEVTECAFVSYFTGGFRITLYYLDNEKKYHVAVCKGETNENGANKAINLDLDKMTDITLSNIPMFQCWYPNFADENDDEVDNTIGTPVFSMALDAFKQLDLGYTAYYKEVKLGQKVKFVSTDVMEYDNDGNLLTPFDENDESVIYVKDASVDAKTNMQEFNGDLRIEALTKFINTNLNCAAMLCGLGQTQFEFDGGGGRPIQTATGVIAKQTELYRNVIKQENLATAKLRALVLAIQYANNELIKTSQKIKIESINDIQIIYDDNIVEDSATKKDNELKEVQAGVMSIAEFRSHWYDEDEESAKKFVYENGLLLDKYTLALQSHVITPDLFIKLVFGEHVENKDALLEYIQKYYGEDLANQDINNTGFEEEEDSEEEEIDVENKDEEEEDEEEKDKSKDVDK